MDGFNDTNLGYHVGKSSDTVGLHDFGGGFAVGDSA